MIYSNKYSHLQLQVQLHPFCDNQSTSSFINFFIPSHHSSLLLLILNTPTVQWNYKSASLYSFLLQTLQFSFYFHKISASQSSNSTFAKKKFLKILLDISYYHSTSTTILHSFLLSFFDKTVKQHIIYQLEIILRSILVISFHLFFVDKRAPHLTREMRHIAIA